MDANLQQYIKNVTCAEPVPFFYLKLYTGGEGGGSLSNSLILSWEFLHNINKYYAIIKNFVDFYIPNHF